MSKNITFGQKIKKLRIEKGYATQKAFAEALGMAQATVNYYENDERKPDYERFAEIADLLDVSYDYLLGKTDVKKREHIDIADELGLSEEAILAIKELTGATLKDREETINFSISTKKTLNLFLESLSLRTFLFSLDDFFESVVARQMFWRTYENEENNDISPNEYSHQYWETEIAKTSLMESVEKLYQKTLTVLLPDEKLDLSKYRVTQGLDKILDDIDTEAVLEAERRLKEKRES